MWYHYATDYGENCDAFQLVLAAVRGRQHWLSWYSSHGGNYRSNVRIVGQTVDVLVRQQGVDVVKVIFHERVQGVRSPDRRENTEGVHIIPQGRVSEILG